MRTGAACSAHTDALLPAFTPPKCGICSATIRTIIFATIIRQRYNCCYTAVSCFRVIVIASKRRVVLSVPWSWQPPRPLRLTHQSAAAVLGNGRSQSTKFAWLAQIAMVQWDAYVYWPPRAAPSSAARRRRSATPCRRTILGGHCLYPGLFPRDTPTKRRSRRKILLEGAPLSCWWDPCYLVRDQEPSRSPQPQSLCAPPGSDVLSPCCCSPWLAAMRMPGCIGAGLCTISRVRNAMGWRMATPRITGTTKAITPVAAVIASTASRPPIRSPTSPGCARLFTVP